jgi:hypothetical protein
MPRKINHVPIFFRRLKALRPEDKNDVFTAMARLQFDDSSHGLGKKKLTNKKKIEGHEVWEARANINIRITFVYVGETIIFIDVGNHDEINRFDPKKIRLPF